MRELANSIKNAALNQRDFNSARITPLIHRINQMLNHQANARLIFQSLKTADIAFLLHNLGKVSRYSSVFLHASALSLIITELSYSNAITSKMIARALYGIGLVAKNERLLGKIGANTLKPFLRRLSTSTPNSQDIANTIYALGELAKAEQLQGIMTVTELQPLLEQLSTSTPNSQDIANTIYALGELAKARQLRGTIRVTELQPLLEQLSTSTPNSQEIANTIYALGALAKAEQLQGIMTVTELQPLLEKLSTSTPNSQAIANTIYALGELAKARQLRGTIRVTELQPLLEQLSTSTPNSQNIANTIYALGELAKAKQLQGIMTVAELQPLLEKFSTSNPKSQEIANTIYALGELAETNLLRDFTSLDLTEMLSIVELRKYDSLELNQLLQGLSRLQYQDQTQLNSLFDAALNLAYLHPNAVITLLDCYARLTSNQIGLNTEIFERLLYQFNLTFAQCSRERQQILNSILLRLPAAEKIALSTQLGLQAPVVSSIKPILQIRNTPVRLSRQLPEWDAAYQNSLFKVIADQNIKALEQLLCLEHYSPKIPLIPKARSNTSFFAGPRTPTAAQQTTEVFFDRKQTANVMVTHFLKKTPAVALKMLILESTHDYFQRLLHACGKHVQYQFAITHDLNPIILYLPLNELKKMINELIKLGFYQDHRATLALLEALFLRKQSQPTESEALLPLQYLLLDKAIEFHSEHHRIVTPKLIQQLDVIREQREQFFGEQEAPEEPAIPSPIAEQPCTRNQVLLVTQEPEQLMPASSSSSAAAFQEEPLVLPNGEPNQKAYYTAEHVNRLLEKKLNDKANFYLLAPLDYHQAPSEINFLRHFLDFLGNHKVRDNIHLIVPICIHQHWVAIKIFIEQGHANIAYYDSLRHSIYSNIVIKIAQNAVQEIYQPTHLMIEDKTYYYQDDPFSCGAYLIENIAKHILKKHIAKKIYTPVLRQVHIELLGLQPQSQQIISGKRTRANEPESRCPKRTNIGFLATTSSLAKRPLELETDPDESVNHDEGMEPRQGKKFG